MRTFIIGLIGGALIFAFFWYRGDVGVINAGPLGELTPPAERPALFDRLKELQVADRAIAGDLPVDTQAAVVIESAPKYYAGQLIAKPRAQEESGLGLVQSMSAGVTTQAAGPALGGRAAQRAAAVVGKVETGGGDTLLINLDYDLLAAAPAPRIALPDGVPPPDALVQSLSFRAGDRRRSVAAGEQKRVVEGAVDERCDETDRSVGGRIACAAVKLEATGQFEYVEANNIISHEMEPRGATFTALPTDPLFGLQWNFRAQGEGVDQSKGGAGFLDYWSRQRQEGSRDVVVAVVDTGLDMSHPDIAASGNIARGIDMISVPFYGNDGDGRDLDPTDAGDSCDGTIDDSFHGTHVAGTIGAVATNNGDGVAGGAWNVTIVPVRAIGKCGGLQSDINDAIRWAAGVEPSIVETGDGGTILFANPNPADIINLSLGFHAPKGCPRSTQDAINDAVAAGAIVVAAAGNASVNVAGYGPSGCANVVTVSAGDGAGELAPYSNWGDGVDIMAPGGDMRKDVDGDGRPDGILSTKRARDCRDPVTREKIDTCVYAYENGTSMAAPHISAALALLKSAHPTWTNDRLVSTLVDTARTPRAQAQCKAACAQTPGGTPISGEPGMCFRPCGSGLLDLGKAVAGAGGPFVAAGE